jgi:MinD-like ATPase involved in chromosome partitioning or flagellar assembly
MSVKRILPVASGKGGVGKSTFAINFALALSRVAPTALIDLDTGTSSIRNTVDAPVTRDLYHFFRKGEPLDRCLTLLPESLDPHGQFRNFAFVAAPRHAMEEFTNLSDEHRFHLMRAVIALPVTYVVLDLRAGMDSNVLDFLPHSNSGILVFTPHHPAATAAAADIVKALLFRKLRLVFAPEGPLVTPRRTDRQLDTINGLLDRVEDDYDDRIVNLDAFLGDLLEAFGEADLVQALAENIASFGVYFVLNMFDGVRESFESAVEPFVRSLQQHVSGNLAIHNLGWIVASNDVHEANCQRHPIVLHDAVGAAPARDRVQDELERIAAGLGLGTRPAPRKVVDYLARLDPDQAVFDQLEVLRAMHHDTATLQVRDNFGYIARRALHLLHHAPPDRFGQRRLLTPFELFQALFAAAGVATREPDGDGDGALLP